MGEGAQPGQDPAVAGDPVVPDDAPLSDDAPLPEDAQLPEDAVVPAHFDDAEQAARAIAPRRNVWIWVNVGLVAVVCVLAVVAGPQVAALALAAQSALAGIVRLVVREPVAGLEVRSRWLDVGFYLGAAVALVALALTAPVD
ncbi:DUF3017 domain-containing protein [Sanguibacter sp. HDW7]|uniref:DUF3017 domain-containing protein n=1 Tax=Sanguibacter sp. HDW7 TaxID=2714931 RepID=UPI00140C7A63|nr:DUF3017 domain-containing protein [Sanguibacter sp. HDW7]QIK82822.1 DUF3017 domain-containing protein [Sanguibacter sp. HDW7]